MYLIEIGVLSRLLSTIKIVLRLHSAKYSHDHTNTLWKGQISSKITEKFKLE